MAVLKDLIVHGPSRFVGITEFTNLKANKIKATEGIFNKLIATTADFDSMTANNATVVGLLDVKGELHTNSWTNSNIATIEGSFYITPTISCASGTFNYDGTNITLTADSGCSFAISSLYINSSDNAGTTIAWSAYSEVLITGQVAVGNEKVPLGTIKGKITSTTPTTSKIIINSLTDGKGTTSNVLASIGTGSKDFYDIKISLLKRGNGSNVANALPIGIYMTAMGQNGTTFLDIYGGHNAASTAVAGGLAKPVLRIGNLSGLPDVGGKTPGGYGIYTSNGYFTGTIVSTSGTIGNWSITSSSIQTGAFNTAGKMYFGNSGISLGTTFRVTSAGELTATSGTIGGITIGGTYLTTNAARQTYNATTAGLTITSTGIGAGNGTANTFKVVAATGALTAGNATLTGGSIAGWTFNTTSLYKTNATPGYSTSTMVISTGTKSTYNIGDGGTDEKTWMLSAGRGFGVTTAGTLYATGAHISGAITATSGSFKNIQIKNDNDAVVANIVSNQLTFYYNSSGTTVQKAATFGSNGIILYKNNSKRAEITSTGLDVYSDGTTKVASFGTNTTIGNTSGTNKNVYITSSAINLREGTTSIASFSIGEIDKSSSADKLKISTTTDVIGFFTKGSDEYPGIVIKDFGGTSEAHVVCFGCFPNFSPGPYTKAISTSSALTLSGTMTQIPLNVADYSNNLGVHVWDITNNAIWLNQLDGVIVEITASAYIQATSNSVAFIHIFHYSTVTNSEIEVAASAAYFPASAAASIQITPRIYSTPLYAGDRLMLKVRITSGAGKVVCNHKDTFLTVKAI